MLKAETGVRAACSLGEEGPRVGRWGPDAWPEPSEGDEPLLVPLTHFSVLKGVI